VTVTLPMTDRDPGARDRMTAGSTVTNATCVHEALAHLRRTGESAAVVYRAGRPVGVVTAAALVRARNSLRADVPLAAVMDFVAVPVDARAEALEIVHRFNRAAWDWLTHGR
jgi:CBS domain-containing protein